MNATRGHTGIVRSRRLFFAAGALALGAIIVADNQGWLLVRRHDDMAAYHGVRATVIRIIDGDTIEIDRADAREDRPSTHIVLWGINCPELARPGSAAEPFAEEAAAFTTAQALNNSVTMWLESHQTRDAFGRVLAHIELPNRTRLNEALLEAGLAKVDDRIAHSMLTRYAQLQINAQRRAAGVWSKRK